MHSPKLNAWMKTRAFLVNSILFKSQVLHPHGLVDDAHGVSIPVVLSLVHELLDVGRLDVGLQGLAVSPVLNDGVLQFVPACPKTVLTH